MPTTTATKRAVHYRYNAQWPCSSESIYRHSCISQVLMFPPQRSERHSVYFVCVGVTSVVQTIRGHPYELLVHIYR